MLKIAYINGARLKQAMQAAAGQLRQQRQAINRINVFPVADGDTGTNLLFTFRSISSALQEQPLESGGQNRLALERSGPKQSHQALAPTLKLIADAAVDGARGNSGAIMAQFLYGLHESGRGLQRMTAAQFASAVAHAAKLAQQAMADPVNGTMPTVQLAYANSISHMHEQGENDIYRLLQQGLRAAQQALHRTPEQLPVLRAAGVVDAGARGFVDVLEGIQHLIDSGTDYSSNDADVLDISADHVLIDHSNPEHRYCTECVIDGQCLQRQQLMRELRTLDASCLVLAGGEHRLRVHIHVDHPGAAFAVCRRHGELTQQKADDMYLQTAGTRQLAQVAIVTDSGADLPDQLATELLINKVPLRFNFADTEYLDRLDMTVAEFYRRMARSTEHPQTSQPPSGDYRRLYGMLGDHRNGIINITVSGGLSGTVQAARQAVHAGENVHVFDSLNASGGQGLLAIAAARMAAEQAPVQEILQALELWRKNTFTIAVARNLSHAARGGRVPNWLARLSALLRIKLILKTSVSGKLKPAGVAAASKPQDQTLFDWLLRHVAPTTSCRMLISHGDDGGAAARLQDRLRQNYSAMRDCWIAETGPAIGAHAGPGVLVLAVQILHD